MSAAWLAAIAAEEAPTPGMPQRGLFLLRQPHAEHASLCAYPSGEPLWEPPGAPSAWAASPSGAWAALMVAGPDERSELWLFDVARCHARRVETPSFAHDAPVWDEAARAFVAVSTPARVLVALAPEGPTAEAVCAVPDGERWRLFEGSPRPLLAVSRRGRPTEVRPLPLAGTEGGMGADGRAERVADADAAATKDGAAAAILAAGDASGAQWSAWLPAMLGLRSGHSVAVARTSAGVVVLDPLTGAAVEHPARPDASVVEALPTRAGVLAVEQREGRPSLFLLGDKPAHRRPVGLPAALREGVISGVAEDPTRPDRVLLRWEDALRPPRLLPLPLPGGLADGDGGRSAGGRAEPGRDALASPSASPSSKARLGPPGRSHRLSVRADDGERIDVVLSLPFRPAAARPVLLTCYGGFGVAHVPVFEPTHAAWVRAGGAVAHAQVRGGGERGRAWWDAARGELKERAVRDLSAVVAHLRLVGSEELGASPVVLAGGSLGGVMAAASALDGRGLCSGLITTAAPLNVQGLERHPLGAFWLTEFPDASTERGRSALAALSPLRRAERIPSGAIPAYLGVVLASDSRVSLEDTAELARILRRRGARSRSLTVGGAGHASSPLSALRHVGSACLGFAAEATGGTVRPSPVPERTP